MDGAPRDSAKIVAVQVDEIEDALLIELIGIVELAGDDPPAVRKRVNEGVDERLIVQTDFTARGIPGVVTLERTETVDEPVGLRTVVVREDGEIHRRGRRPGHRPELPAGAAQDPGDLHGLGAAGELPEQLVAAAQRIRGTGSRLWLERIRELDAVDHLVPEARTLSDVELVAVAVAGPQALVALTRLVERVEVHDQVELVVRAVRHPGVGVGIVGAGLVEDRQSLAVTRGAGGRNERTRRGDECC